MKLKFLLPAILLVSLPLSGHDFWIRPSSFRPALGETVSVSLRVGQQFMGDPVGRSAQIIHSFVVRDAAGERPVNGEEATDPAGSFKAQTGGAIVLGYQSNPQFVWLPAPKFEAYLREEGLEHIAVLRERQSQTARPGRERFTRFAKSLLYAGGNATSAKMPRPFGYRLEIVPQTNPYFSKGDSVSFLLLYESKPLANVLVVATSEDGSSARMKTRTDTRGKVTFRLGRGTWLINAVHMVAAPPGANADWDSLWASLTFDRDGGDQKAGSTPNDDLGIKEIQQGSFARMPNAAHGVKTHLSFWDYDSPVPIAVAPRSLRSSLHLITNQFNKLLTRTGGLS